MQTMYSLRMQMMIERLNKQIAPCYASVKHETNGQYTVILSDDYADEWICTGTYHEAIVALMALKVAHNYF